MSKQRVAQDGVEELRLRIWKYRQRGLTLKQIGQIDSINLAPSSVHYHLKKIASDQFESFDRAGAPEVVGEFVLHYKELYQEALRNMAETERGTLLRCSMIDLAGRRLDRMVKFSQEAGLIPKAADRVDVSVRDMRQMSTDEIDLEIRNLQKELAFSPKDFINNPDPKAVAAATTIDVTPVQKMDDAFDDDDDESLEVDSES